MSSPYIGEIRIFGGNFAPAGWELCDGRLLAISEYDSLFQVIGTTYGGDGQSTFALPDLRGRFPMHQGNGVILAETGGAEETTLTVSQIPAHRHSAVCSDQPGNQSSPIGNYWGAVSAAVNTKLYSSINPIASMAPQVLASTGGSQPHENMSPGLGITFIISLYGIFPSP